MRTIIKKGKIENYFSQFTYSKAMQLYMEDYILDLTVEEIEREYGVEAIVASEEYGEYLVKLNIDKENNINLYSCTCDEFDHKGKPCVHIGACYLKYINEMERVPSDLEDLLTMYNQDNSNEIQGEPLTLEVILNHYPSKAINNFIELKAGTTKTYGIKNIKYFLNSYIRKEPTQLGREVIDFSKVSLNKTDEELLGYFIELMEMDNIFLSSHGSSIKLMDDKRIYIMEPHFPRVMEILKGKSISLVLPIGEFTQVVIKKENIDIDFLLKEDGDGLKLTFQGPHIPFPLSSKGDYYFYKDSIWEMKDKNQGYFMALFDTMLKNPAGSLNIGKDEKGRFASFLMPHIEKMGNIHIDDNVKNEFIKEDFNPEFYIDTSRNHLIVKVYFLYGDIKLNPLKKHGKIESQGILIRNIEKEKEILEFFRNYEFDIENEKFILSNEEQRVEFIIEGINVLKEKGEVYYSESFKLIKVMNTTKSKIKVRLNDEDFLGISFDFVDIPREELAAIISAFNDGKKYYKLKDNGIVLLQGNILSNISQIADFQDLKEDYFQKEEITLPKYMAPYINEKFKDEKGFVRDKAFRQIINNIEETKDMDIQVPTILKADLRDYQVNGFQWISTLSKCGFGGILADEMGLGKTIQSIAYISSLDKGTSLIICPTSLLYNWKEEFENFAPSLKVAVMSGGKEERQELLEKFNNYHVFIVSYTVVTRDIEDYEKYTFASVIVDEGQNMKNPLSQRSKAIKRLKGKFRLVLTGTPIENALTELWSIFDFIMPGYLLNNTKFQRKYEVPIVRDGNGIALKELKDRINPFILRRLKKDVIEELPPKIERTIKIDMTPEQKAVYVAYVKIVTEQFIKISNKSDEVRKIEILSALTRLRQICCHPASFLMDYEGESGKFEAFYDILDASIEEGHKILVFSQFTSVLSIISKDLNKKNIDFSYLDGNIPSKERMALVKDFNSGNNKVFLISLKAGGAGLNLTSADIVIHFDPWWNPSVEDQATDRAHRIGQKNTVEVIKLITKGTIEEKVLKLQDKKRAMIKDVIGEEEIGSTLSSLDLQDLKNLFTLD